MACSMPNIRLQMRQPKQNWQKDCDISPMSDTYWDENVTCWLVSGVSVTKPVSLPVPEPDRHEPVTMAAKVVKVDGNSRG